MSEFIVVFVTAPNEDEATKIAEEVVSSGLAGCVNIIRNVRSIYQWQGKIEDEPEVFMVIKTKGALFERLSQKIRELHSYSVPEIIALPVEVGQPDYIKWLGSVTLQK